MNDASQSQQTRPSATEIEERAADWLMARRDQKSWTEDDQKNLDAWLAVSFANQVAYFRLEAAVGRAERLRALRPSLNQPRSIWPVVFKTAVAFSLVAIVGVAGTKYFLEPYTSAYQTSFGARETLSLNDGSQIELNSDTSVRIVQNANARRAWLDKGEAYFQIKHDAQHPFVVMAGENRVTDLGTKFAMRRYSDHVEVTLVEGSVRLDTAERVSTARSAILKPGDVATVRAGSIAVIRKSPRDVADGLGWRRGILIFRYTTLAQAAAEFNRYNRRQIVVSDPHVAQLTIYGAFAANDAAAFADAAQIDFKLHIENRNGQIVLAR